MRLPVVFVLALTVTSPLALAQQSKNEAQMREMMEGAQKMQECMSKLDPSVMETMKREGEAMAAEVDALCTAGKRDKAQDQAIAYGQKISATSAFKQMRKCGEMMRGATMQSTFPMPGEPQGGAHVCDEPR